jgi:hypothetical protein
MFARASGFILGHHLAELSSSLDAPGIETRRLPGQAALIGCEGRAISESRLIPQRQYCRRRADRPTHPLTSRLGWRLCPASAGA